MFHDPAFAPTVMVVDDSPDVLRILGGVLAPQYRVKVANSGQRALAMLARDVRPELILLDVLMPELDGYAVLKRMKADPALQDIPVIFLTAKNATEDEEKGLEAGAVDYIAKPVRPPIVLARVQTQLELKRARDWLRDQNQVLEVEVARRAAENELILAATAEGIYGVDLSGRFTFVNPTAASMLGYEPAELLGRESHATLLHSHPDGSPFSHKDCALSAALSSGSSIRGIQSTFWCKDGAPLPVEYSALPMLRGAQRVGLVVTFTDIRERLRYQDQLERKSNYDELTGLPNRNLLNDRVARALLQCRQHGDEMAVLLVSLIRYKDINDTLGRQIGDRLLHDVAQRLCLVSQGADTVARLDGDEFVILASLELIEGTLLQALIDAMALPFRADGEEVFVRASIGVAVAPRDGDSVDLLLRNASAAAYRAKAAGGGMPRFYASAMNARSLERLKMAAELRHAVERQELLLHYQPQVNLHSGAIMGAEALVRWRHPDRGLVPPDEFISLAEDSGMMGALGEWVLREACRQNRAWLDAGLPAVTVAVNLSVHQFEAGDVAALVRQVLADSDLPPSALELELTESAVMADAEAFVRSTQDLKALGITLSLDDFGTGYSSLSLLQRLSLDRLKVDKSFVRHMVDRPDSAAIVQAVLSLGHILKLAVIAEGVETASQAELLKSLGCDEFQGFLFSRPVPPEVFAGLLQGDHARQVQAAVTPPP